MLRHAFGFILLFSLLWVSTGCRNDSNSDTGSGTDGDRTGEGVAVDAPAPLSGAQRLRAVELKNRGVGHLENKEWAEAEETLSELATLLPNSWLARRNLAISRLLALTDRSSPYSPSGSSQQVNRYSEAVQAAKSAIEEYRRVAEDTYDKALADLLMGKLLTHDTASGASTMEQGLALIRGAADAVPDAADFRFAVAEAMGDHRDYADPNSPGSAKLLSALQRAFEMAPENLYALSRLMQRQALFLNSQNAETKALALKITETFDAATNVLQPFRDSIRKRQSVDVVEMMSTAQQEFDGSNPAVLMRPAMVTANLLSPEIATQIDMRRINRDVLEYVLLEFEEGVLADEPASDRPKVGDTVITKFDQQPHMPAIAGVTQMQMLDFDLDGHDDLIVLREEKFEVYSRGPENSTDWRLLLAAPAEVGPAKGFLLADIDRDYDKAVSELSGPVLLEDRDGDRKIVKDPAQKNRWFDTDYDVVLWGEDGVSVLRNELQDDGSRLLVIVPQREAVADIHDAIAVDLESDGDLDLVFATDIGLTLWQNSDGTNFVNVNAAASLPQAAVGSIVAVDWDRNIAMDVISVSASGDGAGLLQNVLHGRFRWLDSDQGLDSVPAGSSVHVAQIDGSGGWDLVIAGASGISVLTTSGGAGSDVSQRTFTTLADQPVSDAQVADLDNDGLSDIVAWSDGGIQFFRGTGDGQFEDLSKLLPTISEITTLTVSDVDEDGDLDIAYAASAESGTGVPGVLINEGGSSNHWMSVVARGKPDDPQHQSRRVNAHATGAVIEVRCGDMYQAHLIADAKMHIGLGDCERPDSIRIIWTDGIPQNVMAEGLLRPRVGILAPQILKGSCPYIYTWTGERFEFFSDCLWAAPIGLVQANGEVAPTREWENLLIPGEALAEKDGRYVLQLTEELWEVAYFDHVELTAIDHPADVQIFTNEKVGPPDMAEHRIHTVKNALLPKSVVDGRGNDLLPGLTAVDGDYVQAFEARVMQGLTDEWVMEFDLGSLPEQKEGTASAPGERDIRLFLTGWIFPTDTSLNLGIHQNPNLAPPQPPSIEVPDGNGGWKVVRPFIGFPSGKTKAMVVDISDIFTGDDLRFRLRSTMELYWDQAFYTVGERDAETVAQACDLATADLHYRGFSRRTYADNALFRNGRAPEGYDYQSVTTDARWPPISGRFTKYGEATPLLRTHDDAMVAMGPGDELTVEFTVPEKPVPAGWKRDFVLRNIGYDKDADLNTIYGQSSEPFPFKAMSRYPFSVDESAPDSSGYRQQTDEWQTREYSRKPFWNAVQAP
ncbi:CRTAC1 family protein [Fuerstiella marisgermanici]|uniref:FG-GAP repeat protein n=1 Tax=Fuerstiella marisgermanici TaxID=1891926 RepID=A0A1P8WNL8_9PLAN|nr:CRTAC1 family protein [Fuerstiella marisgermanici]APZ95647.1 hypothetical protein Fuma_05306 [Fuerstiella marisgermanici]